RDLLAKHDTDTLGRVLDAHTLVKDATASMLRADIALSLGKSDEAAMLFKQAHVHAVAARELLRAEEGAVLDTGETSFLDQPNQEVNATSGEEYPGEFTNALPLVVLHTVDGSTHTYEGTINATSCVSVQAQLMVAEVPQTVLSLVLTTAPLADQSACAQGEAISYRATTTAPATVDLTSVLFNGGAVTWSVKEAALQIKTEEQTHANRGIFRRAIDGAQGMLYE
ncbi:MAG: hypothetical protein KBD21_02635, partial [Candidatus Pacebacteria bacterium]|nr:hypothetical protein [Candidatus Paceibacterota bacterium]